jgi:hypothetical protein
MASAVNFAPIIVDFNDTDEADKALSKNILNYNSTMNKREMNKSSFRVEIRLKAEYHDAEVRLSEAMKMLHEQSTVVLKSISRTKVCVGSKLKRPLGCSLSHVEVGMRHSGI